MTNLGNGSNQIPRQPIQDKTNSDSLKFIVEQTDARTAQLATLPSYSTIMTSRALHLHGLRWIIGTLEAGMVKHCSMLVSSDFCVPYN